MERFGHKHIFHNFNDNNIHRLDDTLALDVGEHVLSDQLDIWFDPAVSILSFGLYRVATGLEVRLG